MMATVAPICKSNQTNITVYAAKLGDKVEIGCHVLAKPSKSAFQWYFSDANGVNREINGENDLNYAYSNRGEQTSSTASSYLSFTPDSMKQFTNYSCKARNSAGWQTEPCVFRLQPEGKFHCQKKNFSTYFSITICLTL